MKGDTRPGPRCSITWCWSSNHSIPPMPVAVIARAGWAATSGLPASSQASLAAATAYWEKRAVRRTSLGSSQSPAWKSGTSPASVTDRSDGSKCEMRRMPFRPEVRPAQNSSTPVPTGVTGPIPVTTTRLATAPLYAELGGDQVDRLADGLHAVHLLLGDLDAPLLLEGENRLHEVERVRVQVLGEPRVGHDLRLVDRELLREDLPDPRLDLRPFHPSSLDPASPTPYALSRRYAVSPPSTGMTAPFTYEATSDIRNRTTSATSSSVAVRPSGVWSTYPARASSLRWEVMSVSTSPGHTTLTVMPREPTSRAGDVVKPTSALFYAPYTVWPAFPRIATAEDMFTIRPQRALSIPRSAACEHRNAPRTFVDMVWLNASVGYLSRSPSWVKPALFTRPVTGPSPSITSRNASDTAWSSATSRWTPIPEPPAASMASSASLASSSLER